MLMPGSEIGGLGLRPAFGALGADGGCCGLIVAAKTFPAPVCWGGRYAAALQHATGHSKTFLVVLESAAAKKWSF